MPSLSLLQSIVLHISLGWVCMCPLSDFAVLKPLGYPIFWVIYAISLKISPIHYIQCPCDIVSKCDSYLKGIIIYIYRQQPFAQQIFIYLFLILIFCWLVGLLCFWYTASLHNLPCLELTMHPRLDFNLWICHHIISQMLKFHACTTMPGSYKKYSGMFLWYVKISGLNSATNKISEPSEYSQV